MAAEEKEREESLKTKLSVWDRRVVEADSVTLHPWETGRYDQRDGGICVCVYVCVNVCRDRVTVRKIYRERERETMHKKRKTY